MIFPKINVDACPPSKTSSSCEDPRCADPVFAAANPDICSGDSTQQLVLKPGSELVCTGNTIAFKAFLTSPAFGEVPITVGVVFTTSDPSLVSINASSGAATVIAAGIVTITATWSGLIATSQITVLGSANCCSDVGVRSVWAGDNSKSMSGLFMTGTTKGLQVSKLIKDLIINMNAVKDEASIISFNATATEWCGLSNDNAIGGVLQTARLTMPNTSDQSTDMSSALDMALTILDAATTTLGTLQKVILFITDGNNVPVWSTAERESFLLTAESFKAGGGIIVCVGMKAAGAGFALLSQLASGGFFINLHGTEGATGGQYDDVVSDMMQSLSCLYCGTVRTGPGYGCTATLPGEQYPDENPPADTETGAPPVDPPPDLPQLPCPVFTPSSGHVGLGLNVTLSVPGFPSARIRFTADGSTLPPDPSFANPNSSPLTGLDYYVGAPYVPIHLMPTALEPMIKAIARLTGYADSPVCFAQYEP